MKRIVFVLSFICISACQKKLTLTEYRWSAQNSNEQLEVQSNLFTTPDSTVKIYDEIIERSQQKVGGAIIDSTYLQKISKTNGKLQYLTSHYEEQTFENLAPKAEKMRNLRYAALEVMKRKHLGLHNATHIFEPEVIITGNEEHPRIQYQFDFIPREGGGGYSMRVSPSYAIESLTRVGHCFQENRSLVFPTGPKLSELVETILSTLLGNGYLTSSQITIESENGERAQSENGEFVFPQDDPRFDQVQAYFFAQKTLKYAETHWDFTLRHPIKISLMHGYPLKSNDMYYMKGFIALGEGDGIAYKNIPRDPSIVTHEVAHAIIDSLSGFIDQGDPQILNEGFADYLTASIWEIPELGHTAYIKKPFKRTVEVKTLYTEKKSGSTYFNSGIISGTFWDLEKALGAKKTQMLALKTISRLGSQATFEAVFPATMDAALASKLSTRDQEAIRNVFAARAWPIN